MRPLPADAPLNLHLQQLAYLREVGRQPTFSAAAEALNVSQPALSQALAEVERRLGVQLFEWEGRRRRFTPDGRLVLDFARQTLAHGSELTAQLLQRRRGDAGRLRLGMIDAGSLYLLPQAVATYRREHPEVELELVVAPSTDLEEQLRRYEIDLAFVVGDPGVEEEIERKFFTREELWIYAPAGSRGRAEEADWVLYPGRSHTRARIDDGLRERGLHPRVILESGNPQVLRQMVVLGMGWSVLPRAVAEVEGARLRRPRGGPLAARDVCVARHRSRSDDPRAAAFLELARELR